MDALEELMARVDRIEKTLDAVVCVVNRLIEDVFEPEFVKKIDRLAAHGEEDIADRQAC